jgi:hypothetical protein
MTHMCHVAIIIFKKVTVLFGLTVKYLLRRRFISNFVEFKFYQMLLLFKQQYKCDNVLRHPRPRVVTSIKFNCN